MQIVDPGLVFFFRRQIKLKKQVDLKIKCTGSYEHFHTIAPTLSSLHPLNSNSKD